MSAQAGMHRILIVDDETDVVRMLERVLTGHGYQVVSASGREAALEQLSSDPVDLVIIDRDLPQLGGRELFAHIRSQPATSSLPVILMTAVHVDLRDAEEAVAGGGVDEFLFKPFMARTLADNVARLLSRAD